jgi:hypothetical protein
VLEGIRGSQVKGALGALPDSARADALHVAVAVRHGIEVVLSWNLRHLVRLRTRQKVNAINAQVVDELFAACDEVESSGVKAVVVYGGERAFSAGADLEEGADPTPELNLAARRRRNSREDLQQSALSSAVPSDDADDLARHDVERDPVERPDRVIAAVLTGTFASPDAEGGLQRLL